MTRREMILGAGALVGSQAVGRPVRSILGTTGAEYGEESELFVNPYVTDGLVAMWDGEWNAGWGKHKNDGLPINLVNGKDDLLLLQGKFTVFDKYYYKERNDCGIFGVLKAYEQYLNNGYTIQVVDMRLNTVAPYPAIIASYGNKIQIMGTYCNFNGVNKNRLFQYEVNKITSISLNCGLETQQLFENGKLRIVWENWFTLASNTTWTFCIGGCIGASSTYNDSNIYSIRLYDRVLTEEEVSYNYAIDKARFNLP